MSSAEDELARLRALRVRVTVRGGLVVDATLADLLAFRGARCQRGALGGPWPRVLGGRFGGADALDLDLGWVDATDPVWNPLLVPESPQSSPWLYHRPRVRP